KWNFQGHVVSDYAALEDVHLNHHYTNNAAETMALAMQIGCNLCAGNISDALYEAHGRGLVTEEDITNSVIELYTTRARLGMFADDNELDQIPYEVNASKEHQNVSLEAARKSMVLLKNKNFLPLNKVDIRAIAVIGPNARSVEVLQGNYFGIAERNTTLDRKSTRLNSSHVSISYAVFCLKKKKEIKYK